jgi:hypothetical protein
MVVEVQPELVLSPPRRRTNLLLGQPNISRLIPVCFLRFLAPHKRREVALRYGAQNSYSILSFNPESWQLEPFPLILHIFRLWALYLESYYSINTSKKCLDIIRVLI